jgi:hypothetical protein
MKLARQSDRQLEPCGQEHRPILLFPMEMGRDPHGGKDLLVTSEPS